jgi:hypothetical protein
MRKLFPLLLILILTAGCVQTTETTADGGGKPVRTLKWYDSLVLDYIKHNENTKLRQVQADSLEIEWKFDSMLQTDSIKFMAVRIGHTADGRFITDDWVYIDSNKRQLYGYDFGTDSISLWQRK